MYREAADFGEDGFGGFGPHEGLWFIVVLLDVAVDGALEIGDRAEGAALEPAAGQRGEEALDGVQPGAGCRCEVEGPACMPAQPGDRFGVLVGAVVVEDRMDGLAGRGTSRSMALRKRMNSWCRWRCMQRPITVPSRTLSAANRLVVRLRL